jgi:sugar phosphate isomerase/epimerase
MSKDSMRLSRREVLAGMGLAALGCRAGFAAAAEKARAPGAGQIALQLYTVREPAKKDLPGTLKRVREMGWEYVQWGGGLPNASAEKIREVADAAGLKVNSAHISVEEFEKDFDGSVRFWKTVGATDLAPGGMMEDCKANLEAWLKGAKRLDALGAKLRAVGMRLAYHNHTFEFETFPGDPRRKIDILLEATQPENLRAEFDVAWVFGGGADPAAYLRKYKGRCPFIHVKDILPMNKGAHAQFKPLGQGALHWPDVFAAAREAGVEWYIYEQDAGEGSPFDYTRASYEFLVKNLR